MSYIGSQPTTAAFPFDQFSGNGSTTAFTLTYAPASTTSIIVAISGVMQNPNLYSVVGTTLTFSPAPPTGTNNISVLYLGLPVIGSSSPGNTAFLSSTDLTATAGQTVFASAGSYTPGFVQVYRNGARLGNADFTATNGTTITLANAATAGDLVTIEYYTLTSLTNALPLTGGTVTGTVTFNSAITGAAATFSGNVGIGGAVTNDGGYGRCLQVTGTEAALELKAGSDFSYVAQNGTTLQIRNNATAGAMTFATVGTEAMRITSARDVLVGTTSTDITAVGIRLRGDNIQVAKSGDWSLRVGRTTSTGIIQEIYYNSSRVGDIATNGTGTTYNSASDYRLKENIQPMTGALSRNALLNPVKYKWKVDGSDGEGFIADQLQGPFPSAVTGEKDAVDADGNPIYQSIGTGPLDGHFAACVNELQAIIQEQQALITQLQADVAALKGQA